MYMYNVAVTVCFVVYATTVTYGHLIKIENNTHGFQVSNNVTPHTYNIVHVIVGLLAGLSEAFCFMTIQAKDGDEVCIHH